MSAEEARRLNCGHTVPKSHCYHSPTPWAGDGLDLCETCYGGLKLGTYFAITSSFSEYQRRIWDEAAWYVAERDYAIAELGEQIDILESAEPGVSPIGGTTNE